MSETYIGCGVNSPPLYTLFFTGWIETGSGLNYVPVFRIPGNINSGVASTSVYAQAPGQAYPGTFLFSQPSINGGYFEDEYYCGPEFRWDNINCVCTDTSDNPAYPGKYNSQAACLADPCGQGADDVNFVNIVIPVFSGNCDSSGNPTFNNQTISVIQGTESSELLKFQELAQIKGNLACNVDVAACPDGWLIRPEYHRPQVIYQFAQIDGSGNIIGAPKYKITVPHHISTKPTTGLPNYQRGNWETIFVLNDNSKVTIHSLDAANGNLMLNAIKLLIDPAQLTNAYLSKSSLVATETPIAQITVKNRMAKYYSQGTKSELPDWVAKW